MAKRKTWTNIDSCCVAHLHFSHGTDLEYIAEAQAGYQQGKMILFTDCETCDRRFHIRNPVTVVRTKNNTKRAEAKE